VTPSNARHIKCENRNVPVIARFKEKTLLVTCVLSAVANALNDIKSWLTDLLVGSDEPAVSF
jgi:hypothetical protein